MTGRCGRWCEQAAFHFHDRPLWRRPEDHCDFLLNGAETMVRPGGLRGLPAENSFNPLLSRRKRSPPVASQALVN
jgi:hypothetical protein